MTHLNQDWFTSRELADLVKEQRLSGFPASERGVRDYIEREGWNSLPPRLSRMRIGSGRPAQEYHRSILPEVIQAVLLAAHRKTRQSTALTAETEADSRKALVIGSRALSAHARAVMQARAEILTAIDRHAIAHGQTRAWSIAAFIEAQEAANARQDIEARRDAGEFLTPREAASLALPLLISSPEGFDLQLSRLHAANDRKTKGMVKRSTIYDWFKARDTHSVVALAPAPTKVKQQIPAGFHDFLRHYARPTKPSIPEAHNAYLAEFEQSLVKGKNPQPMPLSLDQVSYILAKRMNGIERRVGREGLLTLRSRMAYVTRTTEDMWPTTIYSADGKCFDAEVADPVTKHPIRPEISTVIDIVTRKIVGTSYARSENQRSVAEALRNACVAHGIPAIFYVDRGPGYRNAALDADVSGLMGRLGITKMHAAPYGSQAKGRIERPNATVWDTFAKRFDTYIGVDMDKEAGQKIHKLTRRELKEFGQSRHLPSWEDFVAGAEAMVAEYNARPHRGLPKFTDPATGKSRHMSPNEAWAAHAQQGFEAVSVAPDEVDDLFRPYEFRVARRGLVQWNGNQYFHEALEAYHEERVMVGYDYAQAKKVWVREFDVTSGQPGALICVAEFNANAERYVPQSYEQKALETRAAARLKRLDRKRDAIEAERDSVHLIDAQVIDITPVLDLVLDPAPAIEPVRIAQEPAAQELPRRRIFKSDEELALWALAHPAEVTPNQIAVLRDCMGRPSAREHFRMSGIDLEALTRFLRSAVA